MWLLTQYTSYWEPVLMVDESDSSTPFFRWEIDCVLSNITPFAHTKKRVDLICIICGKYLYCLCSRHWKKKSYTHRQHTHHHHNLTHTSQLIRTPCHNSWPFCQRCAQGGARALVRGHGFERPGDPVVNRTRARSWQSLPAQMSNVTRGLVNPGTSESIKGSSYMEKRFYLCSDETHTCGGPWSMLKGCSGLTLQQLSRGDHWFVSAKWQDKENSAWRRVHTECMGDRDQCAQAGTYEIAKTWLR